MKCRRNNPKSLSLKNSSEFRFPRRLRLNRLKKITRMPKLLKINNRRKTNRKKIKKKMTRLKNLLNKIKMLTSQGIRGVKKEIKTEVKRMAIRLQRNRSKQLKRGSQTSWKANIPKL